MKFVTKELERRFEQVGSQDNSPDPIVIAKFFNPYGRGTWFATEYEPETGLFFGYVSITGDFCDELGYFSWRELEANEIERDLYFDECPLSQIKKQYTKVGV